MSDNFRVPQGIPIRSTNPVRPQRQSQPQPHDASFQKVFEKQLHGSELRFSAHASKRLAHRGIELSPQQLERLEQAVAKAGGKGGRESLILLDDLAFVVSVRNRTVITALDQEQMTDNVFTNIDSAVIKPS